MKLKAKAPRVDLSSPFAEDVLGREEQADTLTKIIQGIREPFVLAVDSPFGMGKSTFIKMWRASLDVQGFTTLHFNAWENDFTENALVSLLGEFRSKMEEDIGKQGVNEVWKKAKKAGGVIAKSAAPGIIKVMTAGALDMDKIGDALADAAEKAAEKGIENYERDKQTIQAFKEELAEFIKRKSPETPLVFFIDELDRCRPLFAIEVLEHAKHLFSVDGIVFVLSLDKGQLGHSLKAVYGIGMNVDGYLGRFIDLTYRLPAPNRRAFVRTLPKRIEAFGGCKTRTGRTITEKEFEIIGTAMVLFAEHFQFSIRQLEQLYTHLLLAWRLLPKDFLPLQIVALICVRCGDSKNLDEYVKGAEPSSLIGMFREKATRLRGSERSVALQLAALLRVLFLPQVAAEKLRVEIAGRGRPTTPLASYQEDEDFLKEHFFDFYPGPEGQETLIRAIELSEPFTAQ